MASHLGRTQASATTRLKELQEQGHHLTIEGSPYSATVTITRKEGYAHHVTIDSVAVSDNTQLTLAYRQHPQTVMTSIAIHAVADWSRRQDRENACACGELSAVAIWNKTARVYNWYCHTCLEGKRA